MMEDLEKPISLIRDLLSSDIKLERAKGFGAYLSNALKPYISESLYKSLNIIDELSKEKKKALLEQILQELEAFKRPNYLSISIQKQKLRKLRDLNVKIEDMDFLNKNQKKILHASGLNTLIDVLWYFPYTYENRLVSKSISSLALDTYGTVLVKIENLIYDEKEKYPFSIIATDGKTKLALKFKAKDKSVMGWYQKGQSIVVYGMLKEFRGQKYMIHPKIFSESSKEIDIVKPVYPLERFEDPQSLLASSSQKRRKLLESSIKAILNYYKDYWQNLQDILPEEFLKDNDLIPLSTAFKIIHAEDYFKDFKSFESMLSKAKKRFLYEEIFVFELAMLKRRSLVKSLNAPSINADPDSIIKEVQSHISFPLTNAQKRAIAEIINDMKSTKPMSRLLQGDVGSGKTMVSIASALAVLKEGFQVALMVPTEILANQHYKNFHDFFSKLGYRVGLLTSSTSKTDIHKLISIGEINVVIGTHALVQEKVKFKNLGLAIVDEQHRFGVAQRQILLEKNNNHMPHMLYMSATPIPRTIAMGIFGDLDISVLDEMPAMRKPVKTSVLYSDNQKDMAFLIEHIKKELSNGNKVYIVYPLIEESEKLDLKAAQTEYEKWKNIFEDYKVLLLHGRMNDKEKSSVMEEFKESGHILVSTTVIEVGIDVKEASTIVIEDAHRFGLSQLHQLRGRVGRGDKEGYCFLLVNSSFIKSQKITEQNATLQRLRIMVKTRNGFEISLEDLKLRGPGDVLGLSQSGYFGFNFADLKNEEHLRLMSTIREAMPKYKKGISEDLMWFVNKKYMDEKVIVA